MSEQASRSSSSSSSRRRDRESGSRHAGSSSGHSSSWRQRSDEGPAGAGSRWSDKKRSKESPPPSGRGGGNGRRKADSPVEKRRPVDQQLQHVRRPGSGSALAATGLPETYEKILLIANHYQITIPNLVCYCYDIRMIPVRKNAGGHWIHIFNADRNEEKKRLRKLVFEHNRVVMQRVVQSFAEPGQLFYDRESKSRINPVFDGFYNFYTAKKLADLRHEKPSTAAVPVIAPSASSAAAATAAGARDWLGRPKFLSPAAFAAQSSSGQPKTRFREYVEVETDPGSSTTFEINIHYAATVDLSLINKYIDALRVEDPVTATMPVIPSESLKAVDIILRHGPTINRIPIANALYSQEGTKYPLAGNKDVIYGHFQSVRTKAAGAVLNIDRISAVFFTAGPLLAVLARMEAVNPDRMDVNHLTEDEVETFVRERMTTGSGSGDKGNGSSRYTPMQLQKMFANLAVATMHDKLPYRRKFKVKHVTFESAEKKMFELQREDPITGETSSSSSSSGGHRSSSGRPRSSGQAISVQAYYEQKYGIKLRYPHLPCLQTGPDHRPVFFPLELVHIQPKQQTVNLTARERSVMMTKAGEQTTEQRFSLIDRAAQTVIADSQQQLHEFSISMSDKPIQVEGHVLAHPGLDFGDRLTFKPLAGKWDMRDKKLYRPASDGVKEWVVVNLDSFGCSSAERRSHVNKFVRHLRATSAHMGLKMSEPYRFPPAVTGGRRDEGDSEDDLFLDLSGHADVNYPWKLKNLLVHQGFFGKGRGGGGGGSRFSDLRTMVFIIGDRNEAGDRHYHQIKMICDVEEDLTSQVVFARNVTHVDESSHVTFLSNLVLKLNTKLGGINCLICDADRLRHIVDRNTMFMGADVTHPALSDNVTSSIACVTASCDREQYFYEVALRVQLSYKETITDMFDMALELLTKFHKRRRDLPSRIFFFRDGVSEGQFDAVLREEVQSLRNACDRLRKDLSSSCSSGDKVTMPAITVIIVRKRHHTRFAPVDQALGVGKTHNVPAGTTVDSAVVSPVDFDFYMTSHEATVGTSRPTHYVVLVDENRLSPDQLFRITFNLCHLYPPTTKSISLPTPVQYAHLAAKRARSHAIANGAVGRLPKHKIHPSEIERVARSLNEAIRVRTRSDRQPINMYFI